MSAILRLAASSVLMVSRADRIVDDLVTATITGWGASGVFMVLKGLILSSEMTAGAIDRLDMTRPSALNRDIALVAQSGFQAGLFPPLGILNVQFASDLSPLTRLDADHHLLFKLGGLAGEDVGFSIRSA